jgi:outer membrane lipoprotein carrier protein
MAGASVTFWFPLRLNSNTKTLTMKLKYVFKGFSALFLIAINPILACGQGLENLEQFVRTAKSGRADFTQVVTALPKDGQASKPRSSSGTFEFQRPNRFKFSYKKPFEQLIVADGSTLWLFDVDLNQVTSRKQDQVLASTPAALIASAPNLKALQNDFSLESLPEKDGLQWVLATPKAKDGQLQSIKVGLKDAELAVLEINDSFGQRSVLTFAQVQSNVSFSASTFAFKPPAGADVIKQ